MLTVFRGAPRGTGFITRLGPFVRLHTECFQRCSRANAQLPNFRCLTVSRTASKNYRPEKWIWTDSDFEQMGWHDVCLHGMSTVQEPPHEFPERLELLLDIDYKFEWVHQGEDKPFKFWMAPATLVFRDVFELSIQIRASQPDIEIDEIAREGRTTAAGHKSWEWTIDLHQGKIGFWSTGFHQYIRKVPVLSESSYFTKDERGGVSFARETPRSGPRTKA
jgi:hypothetical protein